jgi:hypothetical protein
VQLEVFPVVFSPQPPYPEPSFSRSITRPDPAFDRPRGAHISIISSKKVRSAELIGDNTAVRIKPCAVLAQQKLSVVPEEKRKR